MPAAEVQPAAAAEPTAAESSSAASESPTVAPAPGPEAPAVGVEATLKPRIFQSVLVSAHARRTAADAPPAELPGLVTQTLDAVDAHLRPPVHALA